jgi:hypothetical protein
MAEEGTDEEDYTFGPNDESGESGNSDGSPDEKTDRENTKPNDSGDNADHK